MHIILYRYQCIVRSECFLGVQARSPSDLDTVLYFIQFHQPL